MGTVNFDISKQGTNRGTGRGIAGALVTSGNHTTTTSASNLTDGAAGAGSAVTAVKGDLLHIQIDEDARIVFGSGTATTNSGHMLFAAETRVIEIPSSGTISVIDVA